VSHLAQRLIIALDEWLGVVVSITLYLLGSGLFYVFTPIWAVIVYGLSYPEHWRTLEINGQKTPLRFLRRVSAWWARL
jgi:hypothetical protein